MNRSRLSHHLKRSLPLTISLILAGSLLAGCGSDSPLEPPTIAELCASPSPTLKILGGSPCPGFEAQAARLELFDEEENADRCSGVVLTPTKVLTAAHCFNEFVFSATLFVGGRSRRVIDFASHPDFPVGGERAPNDLAIALLDAPLDYPIVPIRLGQNPTPGDTLYIFGYGRTEADGDAARTSTALIGGTMPVSDVSVSMLQAYYDGTTANTCRGDSGGPAYTFDELRGELVLSGIVSSGTIDSCEQGDTSFFTNLTDPSNLNFLRREVPEIFADSAD